MSEYTDVATIRRAFYRLVGSTEDDTALTEQGESENDVAYLYLTRGCRKAQLWMIDMGYDGWEQRSSALSWSGTDDADGGRYASLPSDFLRGYGKEQASCLVEANGDRWGTLIDPEERHLKGNFFYFKGERLWLARTASPPTTLYLAYHYTHPIWSASVVIDFPNRARALIPAEAAYVAMMDNWLPGGPEMMQKIKANRDETRDEIRKIIRPTKQPRKFRKPYRAGNHW